MERGSGHLCGFLLSHRPSTFLLSPCCFHLSSSYPPRTALLCEPIPLQTDPHILLPSRRIVPDPVDHPPPLSALMYLSIFPYSFLFVVAFHSRHNHQPVFYSVLSSQLSISAGFSADVYYLCRTPTQSTPVNTVAHANRLFSSYRRDRKSVV